MKKIALYSLAAMFALSFAACDGYEEPNPRPQTNPQEAVLDASTVVVTPELSDTPYVLEALNDAGQNIVLANVDAPSLAPGYKIAPVVEISNNDFARATEVPAHATLVDGKYQVYVTPDDLQGAFYSGISKGPKAKEIEARILLKAVTGDGKNMQTAYVGGPTNYYGPYSLTVQPFPSDLVIEQNYYLLGTINGWDVATAIKFNHSGNDPYDDPVFTLKVEVSAADAASGWWWKIIPASTYETGNWVDAANASFGVEVNGDNALEGVLVARTADKDCEAGCLNTAGQFLLTINMEEGTYAFTSAVDFLYTPGDANGWSPDNSMALYTSNYADYMGFGLLSPNGFKFTSAPDWNHVNYGDGGEEGKLSDDSGAGNLSVAEAGLYWCNVNTANLSYNVTLINTIGLIGDATPHDWEASTPLTTADNLVWRGTVVFKGGEFKIRANDDWAVNFGGAISDLVFDGANMASPGAGTYDVTLDLSSLPYSLTLVKK